MKNLLIVFAILLVSASSYAQHTDQLLNDYLGVKNALVASDGKAASQAIATFYSNVQEEASGSSMAELLKATEKLHGAGSNLDKQRAAFNDVSTSLWKMVKDSDKVSAPVYYQFCPMKKAFWLSSEKEIRNPYYGSAMMTCGKVTDTKN
ncbi:DUF3347 domain-containing protein [Paraflavitalea soli]|uniref:DUF3347 domain-containing protein n=1 Tax=Paraflavitalea soli TaxID=2315862 RepID=A0A3B7MPJ3_9BACT|nr:DUF3347 domain-containing protein [Paraflavitalea soli]AXY72571.1 DUF3347 domain-containing protein [Paraflavitalea soli]